MQAYGLLLAVLWHYICWASRRAPTILDHVPASPEVSLVYTSRHSTKAGNIAYMANYTTQISYLTRRNRHV